MIIEYHRPKQMLEALELLSRRQPLTVPIGGGTVLNRPSSVDFAVVDLQDLGLDQIEVSGSSLHLGAMITLQRLGELTEIPSALHRATHQEATSNLRQVATLGGLLMAAGGRSPLLTALLALDIALEVRWVNPETGIKPGDKVDKLKLGNVLPVRQQLAAQFLITGIILPLKLRLACESVARSPMDQPIAARHWHVGLQVGHAWLQAGPVRRRSLPWIAPSPRASKRLVCDREQRITYINQAFAARVGRTLEQVRELPFTQLVGPDLAAWMSTPARLPRLGRRLRPLGRSTIPCSRASSRSR